MYYLLLFTAKRTMRELNPRPFGSEPNALSTELMVHVLQPHIVLPVVILEREAVFKLN